jgi:hypothetical protein
MVDVVEELLEVQIHNPAPSFMLEVAGFAHRLFRTSSGPEAVAVLREVGIEQRHQHLRYGLLDQSIQHGGNAEDAFAPPVRFGDRHTPYGAWLVAAIQQLASYRGPMDFEPSAQLPDVHPVDSRAPVVGLHSSQRLPHVVSPDRCTQQSLFLAAGLFPSRPNA